MATQQEYDDSAGQFFTYDILCKNPECKLFDLIQEGIVAETIYPYIFCGCKNQILDLKREGGDWEVVEEAFSYFGKMGSLEPTDQTTSKVE